MRYEIVTHHRIKELCDASILDWRYWKLSIHSNTFVIFYQEEVIVGAVELDFARENGYAYLQMIEVVTAHREKGMGYEIICTLQDEVKMIDCHPLYNSEKLFIKCGFRRCENDARTWCWPSE